MTQRTFVQLFLATSKLQRKVLLRTATKDQIKCVCEIVHTVVKGVIHLTDVQKTSLRKY